MLIRKMLRDLRANMSQFLAIFLMIFLGVFIYTGVNSEWNGMRVHAQKLYRETELADVWVYGTGFTKQDIKQIKELNEVTEVTRRAVIEATSTINKKQKLTLYLDESNTLSQPKRMQGESYSPDKDGIWLDQVFAKENHIRVGDSYSLQVNGFKITKPVKGLILHPELVYQNTAGNIIPDHKNNGYACISMNHFTDQYTIPYTQLLIKTKVPQKMEKLISDKLQKNNLVFMERKDLPSYSMLEDEITQHQAFGEVFPIVFLLIAVLTTLTTVSKMIMNQRLLIGILKALGFKNRKIIFHYFSHAMVIVILGAILGYLIGPLVVPTFIYPMMSAIYILPQLHAVPLDNSLYMVIGSISICFMTAFIVCYRRLKEKPADAFRSANISYKQPHHKPNSFIKRANFCAQWNIRDILRNKLRSLIAIIGVTGCMGLLICAFGMQDSMNHMINMMFHELQTYDMRVQIDETADLKVLKSKMNGNAVQESAVEMTFNSVKKTGSLTVQESTKYLKLQNQDLHTVSLPNNGIALSYKLAESFGLKAGDSISWRIIGSTAWTKSKINAILHTPSSQGITMSANSFIQSGHSFQPTSVVGKAADIKTLSGIKNIQYLKTDIESSMDQMLDGMMVMIAILILGAVVLGIVVLYNIGSFSYLEKVRDLATLKVLGFHDHQVKKLLRQQNLWLTICGILLGLPFGYALIYTVISTVGDSLDMLIVIQPSTYIGCSLATLLVSALVMRIVSRKVKRINMVSALKVME